MRYFFELGNFKGLSQAELSRVIETYGFSKDCIKNFSNKVLLLESNDINHQTVKRIFNKLGGFIRVGEIIEDLDTFLDSDSDSKVVFGISYFSDSDINTDNIRKLAKQIKKHYTKKGLSSRYVMPKGTELNAAQVTKNQILKKGFELCILENEKEQIYANTIGVQDIDSFSDRDYNKPHANTDMGMLPPKLARIMCNLTGLKSGTIWDPFCGSGTVAMEATILGFNILASDIDIGAVNATKENIIWLSENGYISDILYETFRFDISKPDTQIIRKLKNTEINAIVFEPYMGPAQTRILTENKYKIVIKEVEELFLNLKEVLDKVFRKGIVVLIIPSYKTENGWQTFGVRDIFDKSWDILNKEYTQEDLKWERNNSIISRNIFILEKK